jgi:DNA-binding response OmpR family regulator
LLATIIDNSGLTLTRFKQPEILIVDDDPDIQTALHDLLESEGYAVTDATTCREALLHTQTMPFDAVLLDFGLPDGDGLSVLKHLKNSIPSLPVIMLTAATTADLRASHSLEVPSPSCRNRTTITSFAC